MSTISADVWKYLIFPFVDQESFLRLSATCREMRTKIAPNADTTFDLRVESWEALKILATQFSNLRFFSYSGDIMEYTTDPMSVALRKMEKIMIYHSYSRQMADNVLRGSPNLKLLIVREYVLCDLDLPNLEELRVMYFTDLTGISELKKLKKVYILSPPYDYIDKIWDLSDDDKSLICKVIEPNTEGFPDITFGGYVNRSCGCTNTVEFDPNPYSFGKITVHTWEEDCDCQESDSDE